LKFRAGGADRGPCRLGPPGSLPLGLRTHRSPIRGNWRLWQQTLDRLIERMHVSRRVRLPATDRVDSPSVIGWLRPVILAPVGVLCGLAPEQVEALLAHELAHVRRHDYLVNVLQGIAESLLFYHPAVWWI
jgi:bla regulator protein blaR1